MRYAFNMNVLINRVYRYEVEADSIEEARDKALKGETASEETSGEEDVHERYIGEELGPIADKAGEAEIPGDPEEDPEGGCHCGENCTRGPHEPCPKDSEQPQSPQG